MHVTVIRLVAFVMVALALLGWVLWNGENPPLNLVGDRTLDSVLPEREPKAGLVPVEALPSGRIIDELAEESAQPSLTRHSLQVTLASPPHQHLDPRPRERFPEEIRQGLSGYTAAPGPELVLHYAESAASEGDLTSLQPDASGVRWLNLDPGSYDLEARLTGHVGQVSTWLRGIRVQEGGACSDPRLDGWQPYRKAPWMVLRLTGGEWASSERLTVRLQRGDRRISFLLPKAEVSARAGGLTRDVLIMESQPGTRVLVEARGFAQASVEFQPSVVSLDLKRIVFPQLRWRFEEGATVPEEFITITRVDDPEACLDPMEFERFLPLQVRWEGTPLQSTIAMEAGARYRVTSPSDILVPTEFTLPNVQAPDVEVLLRLRPAVTNRDSDPFPSNRR